jgi:RimJ/RimL family protein N-acetyltransferase
MKYHRTITLKDGSTCILRNGTWEDAEAVLASFVLTHEETDFLTTYPDELTLTADQEKAFLQEKTDSGREIELVADLNGHIAGTAGIRSIGNAEKLRPRAGFGISIEKAYWGLGIGRALTEACIECARGAGYAQLELEAVAANEAALALYRRTGFVEYGRNPRGFRSRLSGWQELVLMRLELDGGC